MPKLGPCLDKGQQHRGHSRVSVLAEAALEAVLEANLSASLSLCPTASSCLPAVWGLWKELHQFPTEYILKKRLLKLSEDNIQDDMY